MSSLLLPALVTPRSGGDMRLVDDNEIRSIIHERLKIAVGLDIVNGSDEMLVVREHLQIGARQVPFQSSHLGRLHRCGLDAELVTQFLRPLVAQVWWAQDADALHYAAIEQFACHDSSLYGLPDAHIICD